jgi:hypothetical protein
MADVERRTRSCHRRAREANDTLKMELPQALCLDLSPVISIYVKRIDDDGPPSHFLFSALGHA